MVNSFIKFIFKVFKIKDIGAFKVSILYTGRDNDLPILLLDLRYHPEGKQTRKKRRAIKFAKG